jgi:hypothetical protein
MEDRSHNKSQQPNDLIKEEILRLWEQAHGNRVKTAHILSGDDYLAIFLPEALSKAELILTQKKFGKRILERYLGELMDWVMVNQSAMVENTVGKFIRKRKTYLDSQAGWIMFYFKLDNRAS